MRLLECRDDGEFCFRDFQDDNIPPYAILSHTWVEGQEVTFKDMITGTGKEKHGHKKIRFCGAQARRDGLQYFWVDTCCIDKANYAELSHSINSMFRWYRNATRCYVYLSDLSVPTFDSSNDKYDLPLWESDFRKSTWFTRGWTLQELLAPYSVEFFSRESKLVGNKSSLESQIHEITGIPKSALQGARLSQFSNKERFSWIQPRHTELEEDKAYSLLGIFDVHIPLRYGEGIANAFKRLEDEINKLSKCLQDLRLTDPHDDKKRIEDTKGGLLEDSYYWIIRNSKFKQWRSNQLSPLLWIKGDPGKGKTMLLCGIINELNKSTSEALVSYFFCQATDSRINNATAVLRGLIYMLVGQQPSLVSHIEKKYENAGKMLFEDPNAWAALSGILTNIIQDPSINTSYLIVDGLDECIAVDLPKLLEFIAKMTSASPRVKWIVSSRNWPSIEKKLNTKAQSLCLELNEESVSAAVASYIQFKVDQLARENEYDNNTRDAVQSYLLSNANGTFLWVALVCQEVSGVSGWDAEDEVKQFPPDLDLLYRRMLDQVWSLKYAKLCKDILGVISVVRQPITLDELKSLVDMPARISSNNKALAEIVALCGSLLILQERTITFVHQSAKDFLVQEAYDEIYPIGIDTIHYSIFSRSLQVQSKTLCRDIYSLYDPGISINGVETPNPDPLAAVKYSCLYWVDHLFNSSRRNYSDALRDGGSVDSFLRYGYLYWLEALSLIRSLSSGIIMIKELEYCLQDNKSSNLSVFVHDAIRFILYSRSVVEQNPLQLYYSALIFAPEQSIVRAVFEKCIPPWIKVKPKVQVYWNAVLQTLEGHTDSVTSVALSPDGRQVVSGSQDSTVRLWDTVTGALLQTLEGHTKSVTSVAFSPDSRQVVSGSWDMTVRLWDTVTGVLLQIFEGHTSTISSVAFSLDSRQVVSGSWDKTVRLWDTVTGVLLQTLKSHTDYVNHFAYVSSVAFSPDSKQVVSGSQDIVRLWDTVTGALLQTLEGHPESVTSVAFSPDGRQIVSGSADMTVKLWDTVTGVLLQTLEGHTGSVTSVAFSLDSKQVVSGSHDDTVRLWDTITGVLLQTFEGHTESVTSVAFLPDSRQFVSGSGDKTVRLWDAVTGVIPQMLESHTDYVSHFDYISSVAFSPDGRQVVSGSWDKTVRLWDTVTGVLLQMLEGHTKSVTSVAFSPDSRQVVSGSCDNTVRLWDTVIGILLQTFEGHTEFVSSVAFSPDSRQVVSGSWDKTVRLWDTVVGVIQTFEGHTDSVTSVAFSPDGRQVVSGSEDKTVLLWDTMTGVLLHTLESYTDYVSHFDYISSVAFSPDGRQVVSGSHDMTVRLWDTVTGVLLQTIEGHTDYAPSIAFSPDSKLLPALLISKNWIVEGVTKILWLPPDYRPTCQDIWNRTIVLGYSSGRILFLNFEQGPKLIK